MAHNTRLERTRQRASLLSNLGEPLTSDVGQFAESLNLITMKRSVVAILLLLIFAGITIAQNLECNDNPTPCEALRNADAVFVGKVVRITPQTIEMWQRDKDYDQRASLAVEEVFKGIKSKSLLLHQLGNRNAPKFVLGSRYLFYANFDRAKRIWEVKRCGRTRMAKYVQDDLKYLKGLPAGANKTRIGGEVVRYESDAENPQGTSERLAGVRIKIVGEGKEYESVTDVNGVYEIRDVPNGTYTIQPVIPHGLKLLGVVHYGAFDRSKFLSLIVELGKGGCSGATLLFTADSVSQKPKIGSQ
jgi:hypothetical protein